MIAPGITNTPVNIAEVLISTTKDHSAFEGRVGQSNEDLAADAPEADRRVIWAATIVSNGLRPLYRGGAFSASAPDKTSMTGVLFAGESALNQPGRCTFGGHVVVD